MTNGQKKETASLLQGSPWSKQQMFRQLSTGRSTSGAPREGTRRRRLSTGDGAPGVGVPERIYFVTVLSARPVQMALTRWAVLSNALGSEETKAAITRQCITKLELVRPRNIRGWINEWGEQIYPGHDPRILQAMEQGREVIYELLKKMGAREVLGMEKPIRGHHLEAFVSACTVGTDRSNSVVNQHFESHDVEGLFICDGSVVPRAASQGYAGSVATLALLAASRIVKRHFSR